MTEPKGLAKTAFRTFYERTFPYFSRRFFLRFLVRFPGLFQLGPLCYHHDARRRDMTTLAVLLPVIPDLRARRDADVLVNDGAPDAAMPPDLPVRHQDGLARAAVAAA